MMRQLGEMVVEEPVSLVILLTNIGDHLQASCQVLGTQRTGMYGRVKCNWSQYWWPQIPTWASALTFFIMVLIYCMLSFLAKWNFGCQNLSNFSHDCFRFVLTCTAGPQASISNLWALGGFLVLKAWWWPWQSLFLLLVAFRYYCGWSTWPRQNLT